MSLDSRHPYCRVISLFLVFSFLLPVPLASSAESRMYNHGAARVQARLHSSERKAAIARMHEQYEEFARGEERTMMAPSSPLALPASSPRNGENGKNVAQAPSAYSAASRPKSASEVLFNAATSVMGMPGLASNHNGPYAPDADQGLGFHADGTVRKAGGEESASGYNGKRAAAYAGSGLGNGAYGNGGSLGGMGYHEPGYDPATGQNYRYLNPTSGGRRAFGQGGMGGYGSMDQFDPARMVMERSLNYGLGLANTAAEGLVTGFFQSPYGGARARFGFVVDWEGTLGGEGDLLVPLYDSIYTTVYTQVGARSMDAENSRSRWIGNFGLGQRWYPRAVNQGIGEDAGTLMLGYNAFYDYDFTRNHARGSVGIEAQYDWLHLAYNYYTPLSGWKDSQDFDGRFVQERAAGGWDVRAKGYVPFYRNVAITGAYSQWFGDNVGVFGPSRLERDPKVWSYGLEYTPISLVSGFMNQRSTERGGRDTEFGLRLTYRFGQSWQDQTSHRKVAELRTVGSSRHEFVDRENRMILQYRGKNKYYIDYLGRVGTNEFRFRILNGFHKCVAGQQVRVYTGGTATLAEAAPGNSSSLVAQAGALLAGVFSLHAAHAGVLSRSYTSDANGEFIVRLDNVLATPVMVTLQSGETSQNVVLYEASVTAGLSCASSRLANGATATLTFTGPANTAVAWAVVSGPGTLSAQQTSTNANGIATATLTCNSTGLGSIIAKATVSGTDYTATVAVTERLSLVPENAGQTYPVGEMRSGERFVLTNNGVPLAAGVEVTLGYSGAGVFDSPPARATTTSGGILSLDLKGQTQGDVTITAAVGTQSAQCPLHVVSPGILSLTFLTRSQGFPVGMMCPDQRFVLASDDTPLPAGIEVTLSYTGTGAFDAPAARAITTSGGIIRLDLKGLTEGDVTITATVGSRSAQCFLAVIPAAVLSLAQNSPQSFLAGTAVSNVAFTLADTTGISTVANKVITLTWTGTGNFATPPGTATTDANGMFTLPSLTGQHVGTATMTATLPAPDGRSVSVDLTVYGVTGFSLAVAYDRDNFVSSGYSATATITATAKQNGSVIPIAPGAVTWSVESSSITAPWWSNRSPGAMNGLKWGATPVVGLVGEAGKTTVAGVVPTGAVAQLTDIIGLRTVVVKARMTIGGTSYEQTLSVTFGPGPLSVFGAAPTASSRMSWIAGGTACGSAGVPTLAGYQLATKLPTRDQLFRVGVPSLGGKGAAFAAGWVDDGAGSRWYGYWTGEANGSGMAWEVNMGFGNGSWANAASNARVVAVCLQ